METIAPAYAEGHAPSGHTAQYMTLARALGNALGVMEDTVDKYGEPHGGEKALVDIQLEAHCATVTLLSAALCESVANTILAMLLPPAWFGAIEGRRTVEKWKKWIPEVIAKPGLIPEPVCTKLELLFTTRNAVVHPKARVFRSETGADGVLEANGKKKSEKWDVLNPANARKFAALCIELADCLPDETDAKVLDISHGVRDYWLEKALGRAGQRRSSDPVAQTVPQSSNNSANSNPI